MINNKPTFREYMARKEQPQQSEDQNTGSLGDVVDLAQAGAIESLSGAASFIGFDKTAESLKDWSGEQYETLTPEMQRSMAKRFINDDLSIGEGLTDWRSWLGQAAKLSGQMATTIIPGGAVGTGARVLGAGATLAKGAQAATLLGANVASAGGMQGQALEEEINNLSFDDLKDSQDFKTLAMEYSDQGMSATEALTRARSDIATKAKDQVMYDPTLMGLNAVGGYVGDAAMGKLIKGGLGKTIKGNIAKGVLAEAPTEAAQGGYGQYVSNIASQDVGLEREAMEGVYAAALEEGLIAGGVGGGAGFAGGTGRAMLNKLDNRVDTQEKIENVASEPVQKLQEQGLSEQEIREKVEPALEKAAMNKGHDAEEAAAIATQAVDYAMGRTPSVRERQNNSLRRFQEADLSGLTPPDPSQFGLNQQEAEFLIDPPAELFDSSGRFDPKAPKELIQRYQALQNSERGQKYLTAESEYRQKVSRAARQEWEGEYQDNQKPQVDSAIEKQPEQQVQQVQQVQQLEAIAESQALPERAPVEQQPDQSIYDLGPDYQPTEAAQRIREESGTGLREQQIREQAEGQKPAEGFYPRPDFDQPTPQAEEVRQRQRKEIKESRAGDRRQQQEPFEGTTEEEFHQQEVEQAPSAMKAAEDIAEIDQAEREWISGVTPLEQDTIEPGRRRQREKAPTPPMSRQEQFEEMRGTYQGTLGEAPQLGKGLRTARGASKRLQKKKQKRLDAELQAIYDRVTQSNPSQTPDIQQFGYEPNAAMAEAFSRLKKTEAKPTKEEQIQRIYDLADSGVITEEKADRLVAEIEGVEPEAKQAEQELEPEAEKPEEQTKPKLKLVEEPEQPPAPDTSALNKEIVDAVYADRETFFDGDEFNIDAYESALYDAKENLSEDAYNHVENGEWVDEVQARLSDSDKEKFISQFAGSEVYHGTPDTEMYKVELNDDTFQIAYKDEGSAKEEATSSGRVYPVKFEAKNPLIISDIDFASSLPSDSNVYDGFREMGYDAIIGLNSGEIIFLTNESMASTTGNVIEPKFGSKVDRSKEAKRPVTELKPEQSWVDKINQSVRKNLVENVDVERLGGLMPENDNKYSAVITLLDHTHVSLLEPNDAIGAGKNTHFGDVLKVEDARKVLNSISGSYKSPESAHTAVSKELRKIAEERRKPTPPAPKKKQATQIGDGIEGGKTAKGDKRGLFTITKEGVDEPLSLTINSAKGTITLELGSLKKVIHYKDDVRVKGVTSDLSSSVSDNFVATGYDEGKKAANKLAGNMFGIHEKAKAATNEMVKQAKAEGKAKAKLSQEDKLREELDITEKALSAYEEMEKRFDDDKDPTPSQQQYIRNGIELFGQSSKLYLNRGLAGLFEAGTALKSRAAKYKEEIAKLEPEKSGKLTEAEKAEAIANIEATQAKIKAKEPGKNERSEAFKKTLAKGEKYSNQKYMAFIGKRGREFKEKFGLDANADIGKDQRFTDYINDWVDQSAKATPELTELETIDANLGLIRLINREITKRQPKVGIGAISEQRALTKIQKRIEDGRRKLSKEETKATEKEITAILKGEPAESPLPTRSIDGIVSGMKLAKTFNTPKKNLEGRTPAEYVKDMLSPYVDENGDLSTSVTFTEGVGSGGKTLYTMKTGEDRAGGKGLPSKAVYDFGKQVVDAIRNKPIEVQIEQAAAETNVNPSDAQIAAENYKKGKFDFHGLKVAIENPKGSIRRGVDPDGNAWEIELKNHYGDIKGTNGNDGDAVDVFIGDKPNSKMVYVIDQVSPGTGDFDEHKVMLGFTKIADAKRAYLSNYQKNWQGLGTLTPVKLDAFKDWLKNGDMTKPFAGGPDGDGPKGLSHKSKSGEPSELSKAAISEKSKGIKAEKGKYALGEMSLDDHMTAIDNASDGTDTYQDFVSAATKAANNMEQIKEQLYKLTKPKIFKLMGHGFEARYSNEKKDQVVGAAARGVLEQYRFFMGGRVVIGMTNKETVLSELGAFTPEQFKAKQEERKKMIAEAEQRKQQRETALEQPKTLDDYRLFIRNKGLEALTDAQVREVDDLFTKGRLEELAKEREAAATVEAVSGDLDFEKLETTHSKTGEPRYVVNLTGERLDKDAYNEVAIKARQFGGRYVNPVSAKRWGTVPGFQFVNESDRNSFANILSGESASKAERQERRAATSKDKRVNKLRDMADSLDQKADEVINVDRKTNTAKRAADSARVIDRAYAQKDFAQTLNAIAESTEAGEVDLISNLGTQIQLEELVHIENRTLYNLPKDKVDELTETGDMGRRQWKKGVTHDTKVRYADYPTPAGHVNRLSYLARQMEQVSGYKQAAAGIQKRIKGKADNDKIVMTGADWESIVAKVQDFARKHDTGEWVKEAFLTADRLRKMGITGKPTLRYALRELHKVSSSMETVKPKADPVKKSEQAIKEKLFANRNPWNDFFPTPDTVTSDVVAAADIKHGMKVLEPSAGMGHMADKIRDAGGDVDVVEMAGTLREHLKLKDHKLVGDDFLEYKPGPIYDRIVMNPPFSKDQDITHVRHAYSMLKPGGKLVAITSSMAGERGNSANKGFRFWMDELGAVVTPVKEKAFKESFNPTDVNTKIIEIEKPEASIPDGLTDKQADDYKYFVEELGFSHDDAMAEINQYTQVPAEPDAVDKALAQGIEVDFNDIQFSRSSVAGKETKGISTSETELAANQFIDGYEGLADVNVLVVPNQESLAEITEVAPNTKVKGAWLQGNNTVVLVAGNIESVADARKVLRHELIAHNGLMESLSDAQATELTNRVLTTRGYGPLKAIWTDVDKAEAKAPNAIKAEEVIARIAESERSSLGKFADKVISWVMGAARKSGLLGKDKITVSEIRNMLNNADKRLRDSKGQKRQLNAVRFSQEAAVKVTQPTMAIDDALGTKENGVLKAIKRSLGKGIGHAAKRGLSALPGADKAMQNKYAVLTLRQISEVGAKYLPSLKGYVNSVNEMMVTQNVLAEEVANLTDEVSKWSKKNTEKSKQLFDIMHQATLAGVDPSDKFEPLTEILQEEEARLVRKLKSRSAEVQKDATNRLNEVRKAIKNEPNRRAEHARMREKFSKLPADSKRHFKNMKNHYAAQRGRMREALEKSIERAQMEESVRKEMLRTIRFDNERAEKELYFPLARFGDYWIDVADENGERRFMMYETNAEMEEARDSLLKAGFDPKWGQKLEESQAIGGASIGFVSDVIGNIKNMKLNDDAKKQLTDDVYQLYLKSMPDRSIRRSFIHRKGVAGFSQDAIRAMADQGFKQSRQQARLEHMDDLNGYMEDMKETAGKSNEVESGRIYNEMTKRHDWVQNPSRSAWAQKLTSLGFVWLLGATPAAALVNVTQNVQVALPVIGAKFGMAKASRFMAGATADFFKAMPVYFKKRGNFGIMGAMFEGREKDAIRQGIKQGVIDVTQAADLMGLAENPSANYSGFWNKSMNIIGWAFQKAEVFNREVTFMTAYRLNYEKTKDHDASIKYAVKATWDSHFDYGSLNRARFMQSDVAAVALQFKQYSQNMSYYLMSNLIKSFSKDTPKADRDLARKQLLWTMVMSFGIGGAAALPMYVITAPMGLAQAVFGEEDDPFDAEVELKKMLSDYFGPDVAKMLWYGSSASISGRIGLGDLWWRDNDRDLPADQAYLNALQQAAGPVIGGIGLSAARGLKDISEGQYARGVEGMMPKAAKDMLKTVRYINEGGVYNRAGDAVVDDLTFLEHLGQVSGFTPSRVVVGYDQNSAMKGYEMEIKKRRKRLMDAYYMAYRNSDSESMASIRKKIQQFNRSEWGTLSPITADSLKKSIRRRIKNLQEMEHGVKIDKNFRQKTGEMRYFG